MRSSNAIVARIDGPMADLTSSRIMLKRLAAVLAVASVLTVAPSRVVLAAPSYKDRIEAQKLVKEAKKLEKAEDWMAARDTYQQALDLNDTVSVRLALAEVELKLGHMLEAIDQLKAVAEHKQATYMQKKKANQQLEDLTARVPKITVQVPPGFQGTVQIDDLELTADTLGTAVNLNPGTRTVRAKADGYLDFEQTVVLSDGMSETVTVKMEEVPAPAAPEDEETVKVSTSGVSDSTRKTAAYVSLGVGGVGLVVGTAFGLMARSTRKDLDAACVNNVCSEAQRSDYDSGKSKATISTIGFIAGGVGVGVGAVLLLTGSKSKEAPPTSACVQPYVGLASLGVEGRF